MNLSDINSGDPSNPQYKSWFNPICNNLSCDSLKSDTSLSVIPLSAGSVLATGGGTLNLTANQVVGGLLALNNVTTVNLPTAAQINTYIGPVPGGASIYSFQFIVVLSAFAGSVTFNPGAGTSTWDAVSPFIYASNGATGNNIHVITYALTLLGWQIYK